MHVIDFFSSFFEARRPPRRKIPWHTTAIVINDIEFQFCELVSFKIDQLLYFFLFTAYACVRASIFRAPRSGDALAAMSRAVVRAS